jgi:hypothetical protein
MNNLQNSASLRYSTFASSNSRGRIQGQMKPHGPLATMIASNITPSQCITSILMAVGHQRIGRRILGHLYRKEIQEASIKDPLSTTKEVAHRIMVVAVAEAHILSNLCIACIMATTQIIERKTAPFFLSLKGRWSMTPSSLCNNQHKEK